jgi:hypothetical protein
VRLRLPRLREVASFLISFVIALAGVVGVILFFEARDESQLEGPRSEPGRPFVGKPAVPAGLEEALGRGNVLVLHRDRRPPAGTRELAEGAGPDLRSVGLAVLLRHAPGLEAPLAAIADDRIEEGRSPADIRNFVDFHLGP